MAGRIIFTSSLVTQSDIHKFYHANKSNDYVNFHEKSRDNSALFRAKMAGYLRSFQVPVTQGL
ncbi:MAG: hypothetical protein ACRYGR_03610 [Janthinobacterium lividum]